MSLSMYQASVPVFARALGNLSAVLKKGEAHAQARGAAAENLLQMRLIFDMLPLTRQVQIAADTATRGAARLAGVEARSFPDTETSFAELYTRLEDSVDYLHSFSAEQIDGSEDRPIHMKMRSGDMHFSGQDYLLGFALPNLYFHCATAYDILRQAGVAIGKRDFLGADRR
ncbi:MAG TPA: DUF1993 domain-containing protein [Rhodanobacteraceae bacterium]|nr:DUF1993 domain-containing protein [Rhodanobacteraceae bacterium]